MTEQRNNWEIQPPCDPTSHGRGHGVSLQQWATEVGVIPALIPFEYRDYDPVAFVAEFRDAISDVPATKATFSTPEIRDATGNKDRVVNPSFEQLVRLARSWQYSDGSHYVVSDTTTATTRWVNPEYVHVVDLEPSITDPEYRIEELRRAARLGILSTSDLAPRFGVRTCKGVQKFCARHDIPWREWRTWGRRQIARTCRLVSEWSAYSVADLADILDCATRTLQDWVYNRYAADFEPPADPSNETWFNPGNWGGGGSA